MYSELEKKALLLNPCFALRFLLEVTPREPAREQMPGCRDSAIFFHLWDLGDFWDEPETIELMNPAVRAAAKKFQDIMHHLPWRTLPAQPQIMELPDDDLTPLLDPGRELYQALCDQLGL